MLTLANAQNYPLLNVFWTMFELFVWILWIFLIIRVISDIFRSADLGGWGKAAWCLFVIILPLFGILIYLIARGSDMHTRDAQHARAADDAMRSYIQQTAGTSTSTAEELQKLALLQQQGVLTDEEFTAQKAKLLA